MAHHAPPRLRGFSYRGLCAYLVTICEIDRRPTLVIPDVADVIASQFLRRCQEHRFAVPAYCTMPDHLHLVCRGLSATSDLRACISAAKGDVSRWFAREYGGRLWQQGFEDEVLRTERAVTNAVRYVRLNPVRAGFVKTPDAWPFGGSG